MVYTVFFSEVKMFGYVTPLESELKVKEQQFYKSVYCGLCKTMGKKVCSESRLTLSYDVVFLCLVRFLLSEEEVAFKKGRCGLSPLKKRVIMVPNPTLEYCSRAGALLAYHNIADDVRDKRGIKRVGAKLLLASAKRMRKKADISELDGRISELLCILDREEHSDGYSVDCCASRFGELLGSVFAYGYEDEKKLIAYEIGYHTGKWIYILDAADDYEKDTKKGEFNPLDEFEPERIACSLNLELEGVSRAMALITPYDSGIMNILNNIIYLGMTQRAKRILCKPEQ